MGARQNEHLSIAREKRLDTVAGLLKEALVTGDVTELLGSEVAGNSPRQMSQTNSVTPCQEDGPKVARSWNGILCSAGLAFKVISSEGCH